MKITMEQARRLFKEANDFQTGVTPFLSPDSEIRTISMEVFNSQTGMVLTHVTSEIFRVLAAEYMEKNNGTE